MGKKIKMILAAVLLSCMPFSLMAQEENGFTQFDVREGFTDNGFQWFRDAQLLCAGDSKKSNAMTIGWGGIGTLWGRTAVTVYVAEKRYTKQFLDSSDYFTVMTFDVEQSRVLTYMGKNSGRANIAKNLEELGLELTPEQTRRVTQRITELGDKKEIVTQEDLPYIVSDVLKHDGSEDKVKLVSYQVSTAYGLKPGANVRVEINGKQYEAGATGDGQYNAFVKVLRFIYRKYLNRTFPTLANYQVTIPPGGRTDALVQTVITWHYNGGLLRTRGLDADQTDAAIKATFKMLNIIENDLTK